MGAQASLGLSSGETEKAEEIEKSMIARFSAEYLAEYRAQLTAELNSEVEVTDGLLAGSVSQLKSRAMGTYSLYSGWLTKLGAVRKNWKRRFFVVLSDYSMAYYAGTDTRGAAKGELVLQGYEVRADCFKAEKDLCIELYHRKRRCFYVYADNREEYEQWMPILKEVCRKARYQIHADPLRARAFDVAFEDIQKMMEVTSERLPEVSEADALTELVCDMIYDVVLSDAFLHDPHGSAKHPFTSATSKTVLMKRLEMKVGTEVATALQSINDQAEQFRRRVKTDLRAVWPEFARAEEELDSRIEEAVLPVVQPALNRMVKPSVRRILNVIIPLIGEAYVRVLSEFHEATLETVNTIATTGMDRATEIVSDLSSSVAGTVRYRKHPLNSIVGVVERLTSLFDEGVTENLEIDGIVVRPDAIIDTVLAALQTVMDQAVYVFDDEINEYRNSTTDLQPAITDLHKLHQRSVNALHHDCHASMATLISTVTKGMVLPPYLEHVATLAHEKARNIPGYRGGDSAGQAAGSSGAEPMDASSLIIRQTLDVKKMTQAKIVSLAAEPIQTLAVSACVTPLIGCRGGGDCRICQVKVQAAALEERSTEEATAAEHGQQSGGSGGGSGQRQRGGQHQSRVSEQERRPRGLVGEEEGEEEGDDLHAWGWDQEQPGGAQVGVAGGPESATVALATTATFAAGGLGMDGAAMQQHQRSLGRMPLREPGLGGAPKVQQRPRMNLNLNMPAPAAGGGGSGSGPSIQAISAQWRRGQDLSLQRPAREPAAGGPRSGGMRGGGGGVLAANGGGQQQRGVSPTRSRQSEVSEGSRSSHSGDS